MATPSFDSANPELIEEVIAQAEKRLEVQLTVGLAADQRAITFAGLLFAGAAVLVSIATDAATELLRRPEILCVGIGFLVAAALACWSARPVDWHLPGNFPSSWADDVAAGLNLDATRAQTAASYEVDLQANELTLRSNARLMRASMLVALISITAGLIAGLL